MDRVTCRYIKRDGSICGGICTRTTGCSRHWKLYEKNMKKLVNNVTGPRAKNVSLPDNKDVPVACVLRWKGITDYFST